MKCSKTTTAQEASKAFEKLIFNLTWTKGTSLCFDADKVELIREYFQNACTRSTDEDHK